jgi:glycosyltransferase involved in cell wall biosynthesis
MGRSHADVSRPIRVAFVVHVMQVAGAEVLVRETIRRLGNRIEPVIYCLDRVGQIGDELIAEGVPLVCFGRKPGRDFGVSRRMAADLTRRRVEVIHAHQYTPFFYAALAKPFARPMPRLILTEHGRHYPDVVNPKRRAFNRIVLDPLADAVNACIGFSAKALCRNDGFRGNRIAVIENGIDVEKYGPAPDKPALRARLGLDPTAPLVVHVARHHPVKDQAMLVRGFVAADVPGARLVMVGDGPLRNDLESLATALGVRDRVDFVGIQNNVADWLAAADVFALTSVSEASSLTLLEAMATGLPVVVTAVGGNPEIVRDGIDGLHVPRGDWRACGTALTTLLGNATLRSRLGANGRQRTHERYRLDATIGHYFDLYRRLASRTA